MREKRSNKGAFVAENRLKDEVKPSRGGHKKAESDYYVCQNYGQRKKEK